MASKIKSFISVAVLLLSLVSYQCWASEYMSLIGNIWIGTKLYYIDNKKYVGKVTGIEDSFRFQDGTIGKAVRISFADGAIGWFPRENLRKVFVTKSE